MTKVYVVMVSDMDAIHGIVGIFTEREKAEEAAKKWEDIGRQIRNISVIDPHSGEIIKEKLEARERFVEGLRETSEFKEARVIAWTDTEIWEFELDKFMAQTR
jgi:hypothetical protein